CSVDIRPQHALPPFPYTTLSRSDEARNGYYFHDSLQQLFSLIWQGFPRRDAGSRQQELGPGVEPAPGDIAQGSGFTIAPLQGHLDRKSTRLNSSHVKISYAVFCL